MRSLVLLISFYSLVVSCKKETKVVPFYPRVLEISSNHWSYTCWHNGEQISDILLGDTFFYQGVQNETYRHPIEFLNDTLLRFGERKTHQNPYEDSYNYYFRNDSLFYTYLFGMDPGPPPVYLEKFIGTGNRSSLIVKWAMIGFGLNEIRQWGPVFSMGNYDWQSFTIQGRFEAPGPTPLTATDTLRILNHIDTYSHTY